MAETVTIQGQSYLKRNPLGVLGLTIITLGIYGLYWYYKANEEILRYTGDQTISPSRSLLAVIPGFLLIVPPFIAYYNTSNHIVQMQEQRGIQSQVSPALVVILALVIWFGMAAYVQEHLNRVWDSASGGCAGGSRRRLHRLRSRPSRATARRSGPTTGRGVRCTPNRAGSRGCPRTVRERAPSSRPCARARRSAS